MADLFTQLVGASFRGIGFPVSSFTTEFQHDHAMHLRPDKDGGKVEATGRRPVTFSAQCIFVNGINPAGSETWTADQRLFPEVFQRFQAACADRTTGELVHPLTQKVKVKCASFRTSLEGERRGGAIADVTWIETSESEDESNAIFLETSSINAAIGAAGQLDESLAVLVPDPRAVDPDAATSFTDTIGEIQKVFDQGTLLSKKIGGLPGRVLYRLELLQGSIERTGDAQSWPAIQAIEQLRAAMFGVQQEALQRSREVKRYVVPADTTVGQLASKLANTSGELIELNPSLARNTNVERLTLVRYYAA